MRIPLVAAILMSSALVAVEPGLPWSRTFDAVPAFDAAAGFGSVPLATGDRTTTDIPRGSRFDLRVRPGAYRVEVVVDAGGKAGTVSVMAELRRLMARAVAIPAAGTATVRFQVDVRDPQVPGLGEVRRNPRELANESVAWDDRLTIYLLGEEVRLRAITVTPITVPIIYLAGDSTVADQPFDPYASWGQMLPVFLDEGVVVANHAQSGSTVRSFLAEHRFAKILSRITAGDHLLIQFGHNDMKDRTPGAVERFATELTGVIRQAQGQGASVTLLTSMERHRFVQGRTQETLGAYPATVRRVAATTGCALVDLHAMSRTLYETLGEAGSSRLFKPAGPGDRDFDHTHHSTFGAYEIARCVCQGLAHVGHPLARHLRPGVVPFDPAHPDDPAAVVVPLSSLPAPTRPLGD